MDFIQNALYTLATLGVANGLLLGIYLVFKKEKTPSDIYFGGLLLALSMRIEKSIFYHFSNDADLLILQIGLSVCLFIGPFFLLLFKSGTA